MNGKHRTPRIVDGINVMRKNGKERASLIKSEALSLLMSANAAVPAERRVTPKAAYEVIWRSLNETRGVAFNVRRAYALEQLDVFLRAAHGDLALAAKSEHSDLFSVSHPFSTNAKLFELSEFSIRSSRAAWLAVDSSFDVSVRPLVASVFSADENSAEYIYAVAGLTAAGYKPQLEALVAAFGNGGGNSFWERSMRARRQRRDRKGRFAYMGGGLRALIRGTVGRDSKNRFAFFKDDKVRSLTGKVVGFDPANPDTIDIESSDGKILRLPIGKTEGIKAVISDPNHPDDFSDPLTPKSDEMASVIDESEIKILDYPAQWSPAGEPQTTADGDSAQIFNHDSGEFQIARVTKADGSKEFTVRRSGADGAVGEKIGEGKSWSDVNDVIKGNIPDSEKKKVKARLDNTMGKIAPEEDLAEIFGDPQEIEGDIMPVNTGNMDIEGQFNLAKEQGNRLAFIYPDSETGAPVERVITPDKIEYSEKSNDWLVSGVDAEGKYKKFKFEQMQKSKAHLGPDVKAADGDDFGWGYDEVGNRTRTDGKIGMLIGPDGRPAGSKDSGVSIRGESKPAATAPTTPPPAKDGTSEGEISPDGQWKWFPGEPYMVDNGEEIYKGAEGAPHWYPADGRPSDLPSDFKFESSAQKPAGDAVDDSPLEPKPTSNPESIYDTATSPSGDWQWQPGQIGGTKAGWALTEQGSKKFYRDLAKKNAKPSDSGMMKSLIDRTKEYGGFTIRANGEIPEDGIMVAVQGTNMEIPADKFFNGEARADIVKWIKENSSRLDNNELPYYIGAWHDKKNNEVVLDVAERFTDREEAIQAGIDRNQQEIYDLATGESIDTGGTGDRAAEKQEEAGSPDVGPAEGQEVQRDDRRGNRGLGGPDDESGSSERLTDKPVSDVASELDELVKNDVGGLGKIFEKFNDYIKFGNISDEDTPENFAERLTKFAELADSGDEDFAGLGDTFRRAAKAVLDRREAEKARGAREMEQEFEKLPTFDVPVGAHPLDLQGFKDGDFGGPSAESLATSMSGSELQNKFREAMENGGYADIDLGDGPEPVSAEAFYFAMDEAGINAKAVASDFYAENADQVGLDIPDADEGDSESDEIFEGDPNADVAEVFDSVEPVDGSDISDEEIAEQGEVVTDSEAGAEVDAEDRAELLQGLSAEEFEALYNEDGILDATPYLPENEEIEFPEGFHELNPDAYPASDYVNVEEGDEWNEEGFPVGFTNNPYTLAQQFDTEELTNALLSAISPDAPEKGFFEFTYENEDGDELNVFYPAELIRDALQLQGVDTNELLNNYNEEYRTEYDIPYEQPEPPTQPEPSEEDMKEPEEELDRIEVDAQTVSDIIARNIDQSERDMAPEFLYDKAAKEIVDALENGELLVGVPSDERDLFEIYNTVLLSDKNGLDVAEELNNYIVDELHARGLISDELYDSAGEGFPEDDDSEDTLQPSGYKAMDKVKPGDIVDLYEWGKGYPDGKFEVISVQGYTEYDKPEPDVGFRGGWGDMEFRLRPVDDVAKKSAVELGHMDEEDDYVALTWSGDDKDGYYPEFNIYETEDEPADLVSFEGMLSGSEPVPSLEELISKSEPVYENPILPKPSTDGLSDGNRFDVDAVHKHYASYQKLLITRREFDEKIAPHLIDNFALINDLFKDNSDVMRAIRRAEDNPDLVSRIREINPNVELSFDNNPVRRVNRAFRLFDKGEISQREFDDEIAKIMQLDPQFADRWGDDPVVGESLRRLRAAGRVASKRESDINEEVAPKKKRGRPAKSKATKVPEDDTVIESVQQLDANNPEDMQKLIDALGDLEFKKDGEQVGPQDLLAPGKKIKGKLVHIPGGKFGDDENFKTPEGDSGRVEAVLLPRADGAPQRFEVVVRGADGRILELIEVSTAEEAENLKKQLANDLRDGNAKLKTNNDPIGALTEEDFRNMTPEVREFIESLGQNRVRIIGESVPLLDENGEPVLDKDGKKIMINPWEEWSESNYVDATGKIRIVPGDRVRHFYDGWHQDKGEGVVLGYETVMNPGDRAREGYVFVGFADGTTAIWATDMLFVEGLNPNAERPALPPKPELSATRRRQFAISNRYTVLRSKGRDENDVVRNFVELTPYVSTNDATWKMETRRAYAMWNNMVNSVNEYRRSQGLPVKSADELLNMNAFLSKKQKFAWLRSMYGDTAPNPRVKFNAPKEKKDKGDDGDAGGNGGGGGGGGTPPSDNTPNGGGNSANNPTELSGDQLLNVNARELPELSQEDGDKVALAFMNNFYNLLLENPSDSNKYLYGYDIDMAFDPETQMFTISAKSKNNPDESAIEITIEKSFDRYTIQTEAQDGTIRRTEHTVFSHGNGFIKDVLIEEAKLSIEKSFSDSIDGAISNNNLAVASKLPIFGLNQTEMDGWLSGNATYAFDNMSGSINDAKVGQILSYADGSYQETYIIADITYDKFSLNVDGKAPFAGGAQLKLVSLRTGNTEYSNDLYLGSSRWAVRDLIDNNLDVSPISVSSEGTKEAHENILTAFDELRERIEATPTVLDSKEKLLTLLKLAREEISVVEDIGWDTYLASPDSRLARRYTDASDLLSNVFSHEMSDFGAIVGDNSEFDKLRGELNIFAARLEASESVLGVDVQVPANKPTVDRQDVINNALNDSNHVGMVKSVDRFPELSQGGSAYNPDETVLGGGALADPEIAKELSEFFSGDGDKSLATLSDKSLQALASYASGMARYYGPTSGNYEPEMVSKYLNLYRQARKQHLEFNPNRDSLGVAEILRDFDFNRMWLSQQAIKKGDSIPLVDEDGLPTDFELVRIANGAIGQTMLAVHKPTGQKFIVKREQNTGTANSEVFGAAILSKMGVVGANFAQHHKKDKKVFISTFTGDSFDSVATEDAALWNISGDVPAAVAQMDISNALSVYLFDVMTGNGDRHGGNFKLVRRAPINESDDGVGDSLLMSPLDAGYAWALNHLTGDDWEKTAKYLSSMSDDELAADVKSDIFNMIQAGNILGKSMINVVGPEAASEFAHMTLAELRDYVERVGFSGMPAIVKEQFLRRLDALDGLIDTEFDRLFYLQPYMVEPKQMVRK